eukprot:gene12448-26191_t
MADFLVNSDPRTVSPEKYKSLLQKFIEFCEFEQLIDLVLRPAGKEQYVPFLVNAYNLIDHDPVLAYTILNYPKLLLPLFNETIIEAQIALVKHPILLQKYSKTGVVKDRCRVRIHSLPPIPEFTKNTLGHVRSDDNHSLLQVSGTVVRVGSVRMLELSKEYQCMNPKCNFRFRVTADPEQGNMLPQPRVCPSGSMSRPNVPPVAVSNSQSNSQSSSQNYSQNNSQNYSNQAKRYVCTCVNLRTLEGRRDLVDYQEIKIQDQ